MYSGHVLIDLPAVLCHNYREERGDPESGELHLKVSWWNGGHHPSWWSQASSGALYEASYCPVRQDREFFFMACLHVKQICSLICLCNLIAGSVTCVTCWSWLLAPPSFLRPLHTRHIYSFADGTFMETKCQYSGLYFYIFLTFSFAPTTLSTTAADRLIFCVSSLECSAQTFFFFFFWKLVVILTPKEFWSWYFASKHFAFSGHLFVTHLVYEGLLLQAFCYG